jgi:hypothetical protein
MDASNFVCCFCKKVPDSVAESGCCHSILCWTCVLENSKMPCPSCGRTLDPEQCNENMAIQKLIDKIPVPCKYNGCNVLVTPSAMQHHVAEECQYAPVLCPNSELCGVLTRKEVAVHEREKCAYRTVRCHSCEIPLPLNELQSHLEHNCPNVTVECIHACMTKGIKRSELSRHVVFDCAFAPVTCPFAVHGCDRVLSRVTLERHMKDDAHTHLTMTLALVESQQREIIALREEVSAMRAQPRINFEQIQDNLNSQLVEFQPIVSRVVTDIRACMRWVTLFWLVLIWIALRSVPCFVKILAVIFWCAKGYQVYVQPHKRYLLNKSLWHYKTAKRAYVALCLISIVVVLKLC